VRRREKAVESVHEWSAHKARSMTPPQITSAWNRLREQGWLAEEPVADGATLLSCGAPQPRTPAETRRAFRDSPRRRFRARLRPFDALAGS
jgi:hypothetical protein